MNLAPIALFAYNRPEHLQASLDALSLNPLASQSRLYLYSDGPKRHLDRSKVDMVRAVARRAKGFGEITLIERDINLGLVASITGEVRNLCEKFGRVIVLEDDLIPAPQFLTFMNEALGRFEGESRVMQVSRYMYPVDGQDGNRVVLLPTTSCWGWGTWHRAWNAYDPSLKGFESLKANPGRRRAFNLDGHYDYVKLLTDHVEGRVNSWGAVWYLNVFMLGGVTAYPPSSLISNIGFDGSGTHSQRSDLGQVELKPIGETLVWPNAIEVDQSTYLAVKKLIRGSKRGLRHWLRNLFPV